MGVVSRLMYSTWLSLALYWPDIIHLNTSYACITGLVSALGQCSNGLERLMHSPSARALTVTTSPSCTHNAHTTGPYFMCVHCKVCNISILNSMVYVLDGKDRRTEQQAKLRRKCYNTLVWTILYRTSYIHVCMSGIYSDLTLAQQLWYFPLQNKLVILSV